MNMLWDVMHDPKLKGKGGAKDDGKPEDTLTTCDGTCFKCKKKGHKASVRP